MSEVTNKITSRKNHIIRFKRISSKRLNNPKTHPDIKALLCPEKISSTIFDFLSKNNISIDKIVIKDFNQYSFIKFYGTDEDYRKVHDFIRYSSLKNVTIIARSKK